MLVRVSCHPTQIEEYENYYNSMGLYLLDKQVLDQDNITLVFKGERVESVATAAYYDSSAQAFLEFSDGTTSPLYVRRSHWLDD